MTKTPSSTNSRPCVTARYGVTTDAKSRGWDLLLHGAKTMGIPDDAALGEQPEPFEFDSHVDSSPLGTVQDARTTAARTRLPFTAIERRIDAVEAANRLRAAATDLLGKLSHSPDDADTNDIAVRCVEAIAAVALWRSAASKAAHNE